MKYLYFLLFLVAGIGNAQTTYVSTIAEHWFDEQDTESVKEEMKRDITLMKIPTQLPLSAMVKKVQSFRSGQPPINLMLSMVRV